MGNPKGTPSPEHPGQPRPSSFGEMRQLADGAGPHPKKAGLQTYIWRPEARTLTNNKPLALCRPKPSGCPSAVCSSVALHGWDFWVLVSPPKAAGGVVTLHSPLPAAARQTKPVVPGFARRFCVCSNRPVTCSVHFRIAPAIPGHLRRLRKFPEAREFWKALCEHPLPVAVDPWAPEQS